MQHNGTAEDMMMMGVSLATVMAVVVARLEPLPPAELENDLALGLPNMSTILADMPTARAHEYVTLVSEGQNAVTLGPPATLASSEQAAA